MNVLQFSIFVAFLLSVANCQYSTLKTLVLSGVNASCPIAYLRYSAEHSYCKPRNHTCQIFQSGVSEEDVRIILDEHNLYRNLVATGNESEAGGMPKAANMMQMVWDEELAAVAQKHAQQCRYEHDCGLCRQVENFQVGQNLALRTADCSYPCHSYSVPLWKNVISAFYDEVSDFDKRYVTSYRSAAGKMYGHFTQLVWAETWRVGCGYVAYKQGNGFSQLYTCNYGPTGNVLREPVYKIGEPCSDCPVNSCCNDTCKEPDYTGLCKMNDTKEAPKHKSEECCLYHCDFSNSNGDCEAEVTGSDKWNYKNTLSGSTIEIILKGGETSTLKLKRPIKPRRNFCFTIRYKSDAFFSGQKGESAIFITLEKSNSRYTKMSVGSPTFNEFFTYNRFFSWKYETKVSISFSVPKDATTQYLSIAEISAKEGSCRSHFR